jgi:protein-tyrosine phosphatase
MSNDSCSVFSPDRIDRFRSLGIRKIFTLRRRCEIIQDWDIMANQTIDNDRYFIRKWIEVEDNQWQDLLSLFRRLVKSIHKAIRKGEKVFVHW